MIIKNLHPTCATKSRDPQTRGTQVRDFQPHDRCPWHLPAQLAMIVTISCCAMLPLAESARAETEKVADVTGMSAQPDENASANAHVHLHADEIVDDPDIAVNTEIDNREARSAKNNAQKAQTKKAQTKKSEAKGNQPTREKATRADPEKLKPANKNAESKKTDSRKTDSKKTASEPARDNKPAPETGPVTAPAPAPTPEAAQAPINAGDPASETIDTYPDKDSAINFATAGRALREQAARYRSLAEHWQPISPGATMKPGDSGPRVAQLRKILEQYGDYAGHPGPVALSADARQRYDAGLQLAVESYQRRHGVEVSGRVDRPTLKELARKPEELARLLELNAERWDKLPAAPGGRYIFVNVPDYQLQLIDQRKVVLSMKTVVGKSSKRTPEMTSSVVSVVFNPTWTVPRSILLTDLLPKARNNPEAMHKRGYRVVKYGTNTTTPISDESIESAASGESTLRQISGPGNTLGRVKFVIPNKQSIFLHDTQAQSLFEHRHRAFSHGCIRLQQPEELAYALLGSQGWDRTQIAQATTGDQSVTIRVENPPKLFITYLTAWVDTLGQVQFRPDIYHRDQ